jgi:hypothetical protein
MKERMQTMLKPQRNNVDKEKTKNNGKNQAEAKKRTSGKEQDTKGKEQDTKACLLHWTVDCLLFLCSIFVPAISVIFFLSNRKSLNKSI